MLALCLRCEFASGIPCFVRLQRCARGYEISLPAYTAISLDPVLSADRLRAAALPFSEGC